MKIINDTQGYSAGDQILHRTAHVLTQAANKSDLVARMGGDEFLIIAVQSATQALVQRLRDDFTQRGISAAIGSTQRLAETGLKSAIESADQAMYRDKRRMKSQSQRASA